METIYISKRLKYSTAIAILFWLFSQMAMAAEPMGRKDFDREIKESFTISQDGEVQLTNKYGKISIETWDQNKVDITVTILVDAKNQEKANELFDQINIRFNHTSSMVEAVTEIKSKKKSWWGWNSGQGDQYEINYEVKMPMTCELTASNKYGNITLDELHNQCDMTVKYGNFSIGKIYGPLVFSLGYGNGQVIEAGDVNGDLKYGNISMDKVKDVRIQSKYAKVRIDQAGDIVSTSKYDEYKLGDLKTLQNDGKYDNFDIRSANEVRIVTKYTDIDIDHLNHAGDFEMGYGGLKIRDVSENLKLIDAKGRYTSFSIGVHNLKSAYFDLETEYGDISLPSMTKVNMTETDDRKYGHFGSKKSDTKIIISTEYGNIKLRN